MAQYRHYATGDPEWETINASWPSDEDATYTIDGLRDSRAAVQNAKVTQQVQGITVNTVQIPVKNGEISAYTYVPNDSGHECPVLVWLHGGGYCLGSADMDDDWCRTTCLARKIAIVNVSYRLAPEHPFPTGVDDSYEALKWAADHQSELSADITKGFMIGGISAGGNFSAALALRARDDKTINWKLTGQVLVIPQTCDSRAFPSKYKDQLLSYEELVAKGVPVLSTKLIKFFQGVYAKERDEWTDLRRSPLLADSHAGVAPVSLHIAGNDPLRDEAILYAKLLKESGVPTRMHMYPACPHAWHRMGPDTAAAKKYHNLIQEDIIWILDGAKE